MKKLNVGDSFLGLNFRKFFDLHPEMPPAERLSTFSMMHCLPHGSVALLKEWMESGFKEEDRDQKDKSVHELLVDLTRLMERNGEAIQAISQSIVQLSNTIFAYHHPPVTIGHIRTNREIVRQAFQGKKVDSKWAIKPKPKTLKKSKKKLVRFEVVVSIARPGFRTLLYRKAKVSAVDRHDAFNAARARLEHLGDIGKKDGVKLYSAKRIPPKG
jgi:hypothetical protein